jgi:hypothetical protein
MRKLFKERKLFKGGNYMRKYGKPIVQGIITKEYQKRSKTLFLPR